MRPPDRPRTSPSTADAAADGDLVRALQQGRGEGLQGLMEHHQERVYRLAYRMVYQGEVARDIVQEAFVRTYQSRATLDPTRPYGTWLNQVVVNLCIDWLRRESGPRRSVPLEKVLDPESSAPDAADVAEKNEQREQVREILKLLPEPYRVALTLADLEGLPGQEISEITGTSWATTRWRLHQARKMFKDLWEARVSKPSARV